MDNTTFKTKKHFGQHLLISKDVIIKIVDTLEIKPEDTIVEIGVGTGNLTEEILNRNPKMLYGVEIDRTTYPIIEERFKEHRNFVLIKSDFFDINIDSITDAPKIKFTGNLPYNVASNIMVKTVFTINKVEFCVFMLQKEVAEKLIAKPRSKNYTFLSVFLQTFYDIEYVMSVPARFFSPPPKVVSAVVKLKPKDVILIKDPYGYKQFLSQIFQNRRKMLRSKIDQILLKKAGISPESRVEELSLSQILILYEELHRGDRKSCS